MHSVYASKEVLKIRLRCNPSTKIKKPKMLKGGVSFCIWGKLERHIPWMWKNYLT